MGDPARFRTARSLRLGVLVAIVLVHVALWRMLPSKPIATQPERQPRGEVVWLAPLPQPAAPTQKESLRKPEAPTTVTRTQRTPARDASPGRRALPSETSGPRFDAVSPAPPAAQTPTPEQPPLVLELSPSARREIANARTFAERAPDLAGEPHPQTMEDRLGEQVASAARGNCAKGEFAGAGMGLLSLPFLIAAELGGRCR